MGSFVLEVVGNVYFIKNFFPVSIWEIGRASVAFRDIWILMEKDIFWYVIFEIFFSFRFDRGLF